GLLALDALEPGVLLRRLIEVAVNADVAPNHPMGSCEPSEGSRRRRRTADHGCRSTSSAVSSDSMRGGIPPPGPPHCSAEDSTSVSQVPDRGKIDGARASSPKCR